MRRSRLPSDSPSIVTRPGVTRISIALWVTSIHAGIASGRQFTNKGGGRPSASSLYWNLIRSAAFSFQGGGLVFICAFWSEPLCVHTPLKSGSLPRSVHCCCVGGGLMTGLSAENADCIKRAEQTATAGATAQKRYFIEASRCRFRGGD